MKKAMGRPVNVTMAKRAKSIAKKHPTMKGSMIAKIMSAQLGKKVDHKSVYRWLSYDVA